MSVAGESALALRRWLADGAPAHEFQRRLAKLVATPWLLATGEDFRYPTTEGGRPSPVTRLIHRYLDRVSLTATSDNVVAHAFVVVLQMVAPPTALFHPEVVARVIRGPTGDVPDIAQPPARPPEVESPERAVGAELTDGFVEVDEGVRLHYVESGSGPLVVLLHGHPEFWYSWRHQIPALVRAGHRVVAVDMRGYNTSDKPKGIDAYLLPTLARDIERLIRGLGAERAVVVGHDWGGGVAWELAAHHPEVVERLVAINSPHPERFLSGLRSVGQLRKSWYMAAYQLPTLPEAWFRSRDFSILREALRDGAGPNSFTSADIERYVDAASRPGALTAQINYYRALPRLMLREPNRTRKIDVPVLVVWGDRDRYMSVEMAEPDRALVPNLRVERLPDASHWPHLDEPERVNELILEFVREASVAGVP